ncbi:MAG: hypothetical protein EXR35_11385 [Limnohabitans sp.]|nr:hypothetical protein [Limnohabitans sp.]
MNAWLLVRALEILCALSLVIQCIEYLKSQRHTQAKGIWSWSVQRADIPLTNPRILQFLDFIFLDDTHEKHLWLRLVVAISMLFMGSNLWIALFLFLSSLLLLIRWRGAFNGGSDFMTLVVLTGLLIAHVVALIAGPEIAWSACLWYTAIHAISSYFMSGWVKLLNKQWRNGQALSIFLDSGLYGPLSTQSAFRRPPIAQVCSWSFIIWEVLSPLALVNQEWAFIYCLIAGIFHFLVFVFFGLNRFFWAWAAGFPAIVFAAGWRW